MLFFHFHLKSKYFFGKPFGIDPGSTDLCLLFSQHPESSEPIFPFLGKFIGLTILPSSQCFKIVYFCLMKSRSDSHSRLSGISGKLERIFVRCGDSSCPSHVLHQTPCFFSLCIFPWLAFFPKLCFFLLIPISLFWESVYLSLVLLFHVFRLGEGLSVGYFSISILILKHPRAKSLLHYFSFVAVSCYTFFPYVHVC